MHIYLYTFILYIRSSNGSAEVKEYAYILIYLYTYILYVITRNRLGYFINQSLRGGCGNTAMYCIGALPGDRDTHYFSSAGLGRAITGTMVGTCCECDPEG